MLTRVIQLSVLTLGLLVTLTGCQGETYTEQEAIAAYKLHSPMKVVDTFNKTYIILDSGDLFAVGTAQINKSAEDTLKDAVAVVEGMSNSLPITVTAFATSIPVDEDASRLSYAQASAVSSYLWSKGIDPSRIQVVAGGKSSRVTDEESPKSSMKNYRIEITLG